MNTSYRSLPVQQKNDRANTSRVLFVRAWARVQGIRAVELRDDESSEGLARGTDRRKTVHTFVHTHSHTHAGACYNRVPQVK